MPFVLAQSMTAASPFLPFPPQIGYLAPTTLSENVSTSLTDAEIRNLAQSVVRQALDNSADQDRYETRQKRYPLLNEMGCLPSSIDEILIDEGSSVFHGLAFRVATYDGESLFGRLEQLLSQVGSATGWENEYSNWNSKQDHWATKWDKFNQFLWMLQCFEHFDHEGNMLSFPFSNTKAKPDIHVQYGDGSELYVECFHYTKWWGTEQLVEGLLYALDHNLRIERMSNLVYDDNPFASGNEGTVVKVLAELNEHLKPDRLSELRTQAHVKTPVEVYELGNFRVLLDGAGEYQPRHNAHGDPDKSWPVFRREILENKPQENDLLNHRPNRLLVNCLGSDFQFSLNENSLVSNLPSSLDEVWFCRCGIGEKIDTCRRLMVSNSSC